MFAIFFIVLVVIALASIAIEILMRVRLSVREPRAEKLLWRRHGGDEVAATYEKVFPRTMLPAIRQFALWSIVVTAAALLLVVVLKW